MLKSEMVPASDPMLRLFESFCERAQEAQHAMEWSWKFVGSTIQSNRAFWLGAGERRRATSTHIKWLAGELGFEAKGLPGGLAAWHNILDERTQRVLVGYSGAGAASGRRACIKIYLTLDELDNGAYQEFVRPLYEHLPPDTPVEKGRYLMAHSIYEDGGAFARVYLICMQEELQNAKTADFLRKAIGERGLEVARQHPSAGIALKCDTTDMLGLSLRPTGISVADHPSWWNSPVLTPLLYGAGHLPALRERLHRVSWVTVPITAEALAFPFVMPEMNVYVRLN